MNKLLVLFAFTLMIPIVYAVGSIELSGRMEYKTGETMTLYAQVLNESSSPVDNATCYITIYYPDRKIWVNNENLIHLSDDLYYYSRTLDNQTGVYVYEINCSYPTIYASAEIFHVGAGWVENIEEIEDEVVLLDDIKDNTDKIPQIRDSVNFLSINLQNLGLSQEDSFSYSIAILVGIAILLGIGILVFLWHILRVSIIENKETEEVNNEGFI